MKIAILMSTYNGEKYIKEQIDSIINQTIFNKITLFIRDDGSNDKTVSLIKEYIKKYKNIVLHTEKNVGYCKSFMDLLSKIYGFDYYAFCDQDDFWEEKKVEKAIELIGKYDDKPAFYYSEVKVSDQNLKYVFKSNYIGVDTVGSSYNTTPAIGCTCVINRKLKDIVMKKYKNTNDYISHDLFFYRVCLAINGIIIHDHNSYIFYRQHTNNTVGISNNIVKKMKAYKKFNNTRIKMAELILKDYREYISKRNYHVINKIIHIYDNKVKNKISILIDKNYNSKKLKSNIKFIFDVIFSKI